MEDNQNGMIEDVYNILFKYKHESMTLIVPIMILQAKATDRREQAEVATEGEIHSKGMLYRNTPYV